MKINSYSHLVIFAILIQLMSIVTFAQEQPSDIPDEFQKVISVELENVTFEQVLNTISDKAKIKLNYNRDRIPLDKIISVKMINSTVEDILNYVLDLTGTEFRIISGEQILIIPAENDRNIKGIIRGRVIDKETQRPLIGANVLVENNNIGAATDTNGEYKIDNMPVGSLTLRFSYVGYASIYEPDIIVKSDRITFVDAELEETAVESKQVIIKENYFTDIEIEQTSTSKFSTEEIRRAATIGGDISRIINGLPSLSNDNNTNNIIARGGSPIENGFYLDLIEIPNINHLPIPGSTGGLFSILNIDFVKNINVYTGGFGALYGDKLSSVLDIKYREGNRSENDYQIDLNIAGVSAQAEGPFENGSGSWMLFARHSFTDLMIKLFDLKDDPLTFNEFQTKVVYDLSPNHQISFLDLLSYDKYEVSKRVALIDYSDYYGKFNITQNTAGIVWKYLWNRNGYSNTSFSHLILKNKIPFYTTTTDSLRTRLATTENEFRLRNINFCSFGSQFRLQFGLEGKLLSGNYDNYFHEHFNRIGVQIPETYISKKIVTSKFGGFATLEWIPSQGLKFSPGARIDYFSFNNNLHISPRFSFSYQIGKRSVFTGSAGVYYQNLPMYYLSNNDQFKNLKDPVCYHFVLGYNFLFTEDLRLSVEIYDKEYKQLPIDTDQQYIYILDEPIFGIDFKNHNNLVMKGIANSTGIELMLQKKLSDKIYGIISGTFYRSKYRDLQEIWYNRTVDYRYLATVEGGYKFDEYWEVNVRFNYAGGAPYTKFNTFESVQHENGIYDIGSLQAQRLPDYKNLSFRIDRRFYFSGANLTAYIYMWNVFNRENPSHYGWSAGGDIPVTYKQFDRITAFGIEFEF
jgi:hypothetical protein